jgi:hypothetical protein
VTLADERGCELPLRQADLADSLALSAVHLNRTLVDFRRRGLASFLRHQLLIHDLRALSAVAGFDPRYIHGPSRDTPVLAAPLTAMLPDSTGLSLQQQR